MSSKKHVVHRAAARLGRIIAWRFSVYGILLAIASLLHAPVVLICVLPLAAVIHILIDGSRVIYKKASSK